MEHFNLVPILGIIAVFGAPVLIILIVMRASASRERSRNALVQAAIEAGKDINPAIFAEPIARRKYPHLRLIMGIMLTAFGIGLMPVIFAHEGWRAAMAGIIFILPGAGLLLSDYLIKRQSKQA